MQHSEISLAPALAACISTTTAASTGISGSMGLRLRPLAIRHCRRVPRSAEAIDATLRAALRRLVQGKGKWPLFLYGRAGLGKTCAALALCDRVASACYCTAEEAADWIINPGVNWRWVDAAELAVIDEIGARNSVGDLHYAALKKFADLRGARPTIYVSNKSPHEIKDLYDDRIFSRVACGSWFELTGDDRRMQ